MCIFLNDVPWLVTDYITSSDKVLNPRFLQIKCRNKFFMKVTFRLDDILLLPETVSVLDVHVLLFARVL